MCGMALESEEVVLEDDNPELNNMRRRFYVSLVFTVPVFVLAMSEMVPGQLLQEVFSPMWLGWLPVSYTHMTLPTTPYV